MLQAALGAARALGSRVASAGARLTAGPNGKVSNAIGNIAGGGLAAAATGADALIAGAKKHPVAAGLGAVAAGAGTAAALDSPGVTAQATDDGGMLLTGDANAAGVLLQSEEGQAFAKQLEQNGLLSMDGSSVQIRVPAELQQTLMPKLAQFGFAPAQ